MPLIPDSNELGIFYQAYKFTIMTPSTTIAHKTSRSLIKAFRDIHPNGLTPQQHSQRLNSVLLDFWSHTPLSKDNDVPIQLFSRNQDRSVNISYSIGKRAPDAVGVLSCLYRILEGGVVEIEETNERMDLKDLRHLLTIAMTVINDLYA